MPFSVASPGVDGPAVNAFAISGDDSNDLASGPPRALWIGGAGNVKVTTLAGDTVTFSGIAAGTLLPVRVARVWATGTTATSIVGVY